MRRPVAPIFNGAIIPWRESRGGSPSASYSLGGGGKRNSFRSQAFGRSAHIPRIAKRERARPRMNLPTYAPERPSLGAQRTWTRAPGGDDRGAHISHLAPRTSHLAPRTSHLAPRIPHETAETAKLAQPVRPLSLEGILAIYACSAARPALTTCTCNWYLQRFSPPRSNWEFPGHSSGPKKSNYLSFSGAARRAKGERPTA